MSYWAKSAIDRDQIALIPTTLSDRIPEDHSVRLFWELLSTYGWNPWEARYCGCHGQPAIHPRIMAGVLLYGLTQGIRSSRRVDRRTYRCASCAGCPLRSSCTDGRKNRQVRSHGKHPLREAMAEKVHSDVGRAVYRQRQSVAESPFGVIKNVMGVRQFLLRGLEDVRTEWRWVCTAYNLRILVKWLRRHRDRWVSRQPARG